MSDCVSCKNGDALSPGWQCNICGRVGCMDELATLRAQVAKYERTEPLKVAELVELRQRVQALTDERDAFACLLMERGVDEYPANSEIDQTIARVQAQRAVVEAAKVWTYRQLPENWKLFGEALDALHKLEGAK